ncbi:hypothetical protein T492DRAFT_831854 [Pavlovales sp. CCMP2436]|nr:hypothetical protein T492DRAFT_831854 [Pavlovales sp. CCMP2436]
MSTSTDPGGIAPGADLDNKDPTLEADLAAYLYHDDGSSQLAGRDDEAELDGFLDELLGTDPLGAISTSGSGSSVYSRPTELLQQSPLGQPPQFLQLPQLAQPAYAQPSFATPQPPLAHTSFAAQPGYAQSCYEQPTYLAQSTVAQPQHASAHHPLPQPHLAPPPVARAVAHSVAHVATVTSTSRKNPVVVVANQSRKREVARYSVIQPQSNMSMEGKRALKLDGSSPLTSSAGGTGISNGICNGHVCSSNGNDSSSNGNGGSSSSLPPQKPPVATNTEKDTAIIKGSSGATARA